MASKSEKNANTDRAGLPFEPKRKKASKKASKRLGEEAASDQAKATKSIQDTKKAAKTEDAGSSVSARAQARADEILAGNRRQARTAKAKSESANRRDRTKGNSGSVPKEVSDRMLRRMAVLSIAPVLLGVGVFFLAYYLRSREIVEIAPVAVLLVTMGCFGLGVLGLTYGVLSASWDSEPGGLVGLREFKLNFGRVMDARRASKT
ncbi:MAG: PAM68 family protein [Phormidesmis sp.]